MKKNIKWLRSKIVDYFTIEGNGFDVEGYEILDLIDQLDEPEALSQEKVQIPWLVYKWIEHQKMFDFTIYDLLSLASKGEWATESMNKFINENGELFIKAWLAYPDIEVEEEQKYYVSERDEEYGGFWFLSKNNNGDISIGVNRDWSEVDWDRLKLTEQEIKDYDPRYMTFAKPIEELEE